MKLNITSLPMTKERKAKILNNLRKLETEELKKNPNSRFSYSSSSGLISTSLDDLSKQLDKRVG